MAPKQVALVGAGSLGSMILRELLKVPDLYTPIILTRKPSSRTDVPASQIRVIDYTSSSSLETALQGVWAVINTAVPYPDGSDYFGGQMNLIHAAKRAGVKRYVPSEFTGSRQSNNLITAFKIKNVIVDELKKTSLEWTAFRAGLYMNLLAFGSKKERVIEDAFDGVRPFAMYVNIGEGTATIPGTGDEPVIFTLAQDIGKIVVQALALEKWEEDSWIPGTKSTYNEVVKLAEEITGRKFTVTYESVEELEGRLEETKKDPSNFMAQFMVEASLCIIKRVNETYDDKLVSKLGNPDIVQLRAFLERWWG
ncbi:NAD(P)-binding protein, partial [Atractiella rhizophila]